jgi:hypothetical protein
MNALVVDNFCNSSAFQGGIPFGFGCCFKLFNEGQNTGQMEKPDTFDASGFTD